MSTSTVEEHEAAKGKTAKKALSRDEARTKVLSTAKRQFKRVELNIWGVDVEFRQPKIREILNVGDFNAEDMLLHMLVNFIYLRGTDERLFEEGDKESLKDMPFDPSLTQLTEAIGELTGANVEDAEKN